MVFQSFALFPHLTVEENIGFGLAARRTAPAEMRERVREIARRLGLEALLGRRPAQLSGGERQRVALARALTGRPGVLLLDEPLSNLDAQLRATARAELRRVHDETGVTMVYVTHDQAEALSLGDRVGVLRAGGLVQLGTPDEVYDRPATRFVAGFVGTPPMNLLEGRAAGGEVSSGPLRAPLPPGVRLGEGEPVVLGVRPEGLRPAADGVAAVVEVAERAGHDRVWHVRAEGVRLAVRPPAGSDARPGDTVRLEVEPSAVRLFAAGGEGRAL
jgi:ABC-type sugar transport system ATPase subunit